MIYFSKKIILIALLVIPSTAIAAKVTLDAPTSASSNRQPVRIIVGVDPEQDVLSGIAGDLSFPTNLFTVEDIITESSVVSLWSKQPGPTLEKTADGRTHITFEGIFPGGYSGVRSAFYEGVKQGMVFTIVLTPKETGEATFILDDVTLNAFTKDATRLPSNTVVKSIKIPTLNEEEGDNTKEDLAKRVFSNSLEVLATRDESIANGSWYVVVNDREQVSSIASMLVAETDVYNGELVKDGAWKKTKSPHILSYQDRSKYIHIKIVYANNTYTLVTLLPVENSTSISIYSRILIAVVVLLLLLYAYKQPRPQSEQKK